MEKQFPKVKKNFGFGCMRLQMNGAEVDYAEFSRMIDAFLDSGFNYFDTAHGYLDGKSETALRDCLVARHPRESFVLANKLSNPFFDKEEDIVPLFESQLNACGVDYFDFYLFHALSAHSYEKYKACNAFAIVERFKAEGRVKYIAMSFHDTADVLDRILTEQPWIEAVQLQFNYLDYDDPGVQSKACYDVCVKHGKPVIVMEPVKGGTLVNLPVAAGKVLDDLNGGSYASYAIRYAASFPQVFMVLSGMGNMNMMLDNLSYMSEFEPLTGKERETTDLVREIMRTVNQVPCTGCEYCIESCPMNIEIPRVFSAYNSHLAAKTTRSEARDAIEGVGKSPAACVGCGACATACPQKIAVPEQLSNAVRALRLDR